MDIVLRKLMFILLGLKGLKQITQCKHRNFSIRRQKDVRLKALS